MSQRLELLHPMLNKYIRPFHVLDIGGGVEPSQNIGQEIARAYDQAVVTVVEQDWTKEKFQSSPRTMICKHTLSAEDIVRLATCQHFDVVLALNVVHWYESEWEIVLRTLTSMADWVAVQVPDVGEGENRPDMPGREHVEFMHDWIGGYMEAMDKCKRLGETVQFADHPPRSLWLLKGNRYGLRTLTRTSWDADEDSARMDVSSDETSVWAFNRKKRKLITSTDWHAGMNLATWVRLGATWPNADWVEERMREAVGEWMDGRPDGVHGDIATHNFIFNGERMWLVDGQDGWDGHRTDEEALEKAVVEMLEGMRICSLV